MAWVRNGSSIEQIWINFKNLILESVRCFVPHKVRKKNSDPEYYTRGIKKLKIKVRKAYNKRNLGTLHMDKFKQLSLNLLSAKKLVQEAYLKSILGKEGKSCSEFYKYVKRRGGNRESIPAIKDGNGQNISDPKGNANLFNSYFSSIFSIKDNIPLIGRMNTIKPFTTDIRTIRRCTKTIGKHKSVGPDGIPGVILKMGGGHDTVPGVFA